MLLEREAEYETLDRLLRRARAGRSGTLVIEGEPGIGKTALVEQATTSARDMDMRVLAISGAESELELAFAAVHQLLAQTSGLIEALPPRQQDALGTAFGIIQGPPPDTFLIGLAVLGILSKASEEQPLLCTVDDAHWLDRASLEALAFVGRRLHAEGVVLVFAVRQSEEELAPLRGLPELHLSGLSDEAAHELLRSVVSDHLDERVRERLVAEARGNALALLELPRGLSAAELAGDSLLPEPLPLRGRLEQSFLRQQQELPPDAQALLLVAAADSSGDTELLWGAASRLGVGREAADAAEATGLIRFGAKVNFRHPLIRSAVYGAAPSGERQRVHRALADATDPRKDADRHAWHAAAAVPGPDEEVARNLEKSAGHAIARGGFAAAAALLERAAQLTPDDKRQTSRTLAAAQAELSAGALKRAEALLAGVDQGRADGVQRAEAQQLRGALALTRGDAGDASVMLLRATRSLERVDPGLARDTRLQALEAALYAGSLAGRGDVLEALQQGRVASPAPGSEPAVADALFDGFAALSKDGPGVAAQSLSASIEKVRRHGDLRWFPLAYLAAIELWDDEAIHGLVTRYVEVARDTGALLMLPRAFSELAHYEVMVGRFGAAEACIAEAREISDATANPGIIGGSDAVALLLLAWRGRVAQTRALAQSVIREATASGLAPFVSSAHYALAVLELGLSHYEAALAAAEEALADPLVATRTLPELVEAAARSGHVRVAASAVRRLEESTRASGTEWALGVLASSRALLATGSKAEELHREAISRLKRCRVIPQLARAKLVYGEWLRRQRRRRAARHELRSAHAIFSSMGAEAFARRTGIELAATGERTLPRTPESVGLLTPQEERIARLTSEGASNPEIAAELLISPRTVEYHLHKVFRKMGVSSRTELTRNMVELGRLRDRV